MGAISSMHWSNKKLGMPSQPLLRFLLCFFASFFISSSSVGCKYMLSGGRPLMKLMGSVSFAGMFFASFEPTLAKKLLNWSQIFLVFVIDTPSTMSSSMMLLADFLFIRELISCHVLLQS